MPLLYRIISSGQLSGVIGAPQGVFRHPILGVVVCKQCRLYYKDGNWQQDEEGYDVFCRFVVNPMDRPMHSFKINRLLVLYSQHFIFFVNTQH
jgi:hypothetical protein